MKSYIKSKFILLTILMVLTFGSAFQAIIINTVDQNSNQVVNEQKENPAVETDITNLKPSYTNYLCLGGWCTIFSSSGMGAGDSFDWTYDMAGTLVWLDVYTMDYADYLYLTDPLWGLDSNYEPYYYYSHLLWANSGSGTFHVPYYSSHWYIVFVHGDTFYDYICGDCVYSGSVDTLDITSPTSASTWEAGSTHSITWSSTGTISNVVLELWHSGSFYSTITALTTDDGSYSWTLPSSFTYYDDLYQIRIKDYSDSLTYDMSDAYFEITTPLDDNYEENDGYATAYDLIYDEQTWLHTIDGYGIQYDDDWYEIDITPGYENLIVDLQFTDAAGDIDLRVYASDGTTVVASSTSVTDNEYIDTILPSSGTYYLRVYFGNMGNTYDLWWDDIIPDDNYEENDGYATAYDLIYDEHTWLSTIDGYGIQADDDWYEIDITPGYENLIVNCTFIDAAGDIDLSVYASDGTTYITGSGSVTDNEYIDTILPSSGTYYLLVYGDNAGNLYDLWWDDILVPSDDNYEENDADTTAYDLSAYEDTWLSTIGGYGIQYDYDWYEIYVDPGYEQVLVDLQFTHAAGNIDLGLISSSLTLIAASTSTTDNEYIDVIVPSSGLYYIYIEGDNSGNTYDLWWDDSLPIIDDNYEPNNADTTAYDLTSDEDTWLSTIDGLGIQYDYDWFEIYVDSGFENILIDLQFTHASGDIDLGLVDSGINLIAVSTSTTDNEYIDYEAPSAGTYYIYIDGDNTGNTYDLWWNDVPPPAGDDAYEPNDLPAQAYDLTTDEGVWLSTISGDGIQLDWDYYEIYVPSGSERLVVDCTFTHADGDISLIIWNSTIDAVATGFSTTDNEYINELLPSSGTYYIQVYGDDAGNSYDLMWDALAPVTDDAYEENDLYTGAYDLTSYPDTWLTDISGPGIQADFDFYKVSISTPNQRIIIDVTYTYSEGIIFIMFTDISLNPLALSNTTANNEHIDITLTSTGTFYIIVAGEDAGNSYDLKYSLTAAGGQKPIPGYNVIFLIAMVFGISIILIKKRFMKLTRN